LAIYLILATFVTTELGSPANARRRAGDALLIRNVTEIPFPAALNILAKYLIRIPIRV
jgi:hypothetical protein